MMHNDSLKCNESRKCFAKGESGRCSILKSVSKDRNYRDGECPFAKEDIYEVPYVMKQSYRVARHKEEIAL